MVAAPLHTPERRLLQALLAVLALLVCWTLAHQAATFAGVPWTPLARATAWLALPVLVLGFLWGGAVSACFVDALDPLPAARSGKDTSPLALLGLAALVAAAGWTMPDYASRYAVVLGGVALWLSVAVRRPAATQHPDQAPASGPGLTAALLWTGLGVCTLVAVALVVFVNRSDFDDAEYIQQGLQTLRHPDLPLYGFDASLGTLIDSFRFAPYRITSYETLVALVSQLSGADLLDTYYLILPTIWAVLSVATAFVFLRWFLPRPWALLGVGLFLLVAIAWGETHVAYGNRMYVRLFQGKGLLVVLTTPLTVLMAMLWMRQPRVSTWTALLAMQVLAVGVSSSGVVITLFATAIGLAAGWLAQPGWRAMARAALGGLALAYPIALGLWLKFASTASGKVEDIGTYLPIEASLGGDARQLLTLGITAAALLLLGRSMVSAWGQRSGAVSAAPSAGLGWLLVASWTLVLNPFLIGHITELTSRNMNWRLAWATPMPLLLAACLTALLMWAHRQPAARRAWAGLLAVSSVVAFVDIDLPTLRQSNHLHWGVWERKLPPEYADAVSLASQIRQRVGPDRPVTLLVEPRVGTWITVVAPDFGLVMPGHGYGVTLQTILPPQEHTDRSRLVDSIPAVLAGDPELGALVRRYGVTVIAEKDAPSGHPASAYRLHFPSAPGH